MLVDALLSWMQGKKFSILFSKFSMPEEIFGPVSLNGLKNDKFIRIIEGKLPCADIAFGDESRRTKCKPLVFNYSYS
jgi:MoxR-like ATPase